MRKVLMVAYFFPPIASVGVFRTLKFAKYLPRFGWKPVILTVRNPDRYAVRGLIPHYAQDELEGVKVLRSFNIPLGWVLKVGRLGINYKWFFLLPDVFIGWLPFAFFLGKKIVEKEKIDVIYVSSPPVAGLIVGMLLKKATKKPLVIDYRDLWTGNPFMSYPTRFHYSIETKMEERVLKNCDAIIAVGEPYKKRLLKNFPLLKESDVYTIMNGFDPEDISKVTPYKFEKFTIIHTGTFYGPRADHLKKFLSALHDFLRHERALDFQIALIGSSPPNVERVLTKLIKEFDLATKVLRLGEKPHKETIQFTLGADVLLLIPGSPDVIPAKIFEYLAAKKFILNISDPASETALIIDHAKAGITVKPDIALLKEKLHVVFNLKNHEMKQKENVLSKFSKIKLTEKLASIFEQVL